MRTLQDESEGRISIHAKECDMPPRTARHRKTDITYCRRVKPTTVIRTGTVGDCKMLCVVEQCIVSDAVNV